MTFEQQIEVWEIAFGILDDDADVLFDVKDTDFDVPEGMRRDARDAEDAIQRIRYWLDDERQRAACE
jgi:hypothetical protein